MKKFLASSPATTGATPCLRLTPTGQLRCTKKVTGCRSLSGRTQHRLRLPTELLGSAYRRRVRGNTPFVGVRHLSTGTNGIDVVIDAIENFRDPHSSHTTSDAETEQEVFNRIKEQVAEGSEPRVDYLLEYLDCKTKNLAPELTALILQTTPSQNYPFSHVMSFFLRLGQPLDAIKIFNSMVSNGFRPSCFTFNLLISSLGRIGKINIALEVLYQMKKENVFPDKVTIATINSVIARSVINNPVPESAQEQLVAARSALEDMKVAWESEIQKPEQRVPKEENKQRVGELFKFLSVLNNALLAVHSLMGDMDSAFQTLESLKKQRTQIDVTSINLLMKCCIKKEAREKAVMLYEQEMKKGEGIMPTTATYNILLRQYSELGRVDDAWAILSKMRKRNLMGRRHAYNALILACVQAGQAERAMSVFEIMRAQDEQLPSIWSFNTIMRTCYTRGKDEVQIKKAFSLYDDLKANYFRYLRHKELRQGGAETSFTFMPLPNVITFNILLNLCAKAAQPQLAFSVFKEMKEVFGLSPNQISFNILINACSRAKDVEKAFAVREDMKLHGLQPDAVTLSTLLVACVRAGDVKRAFNVYEEIEKSGLSLETYETRMFGYAKLGDLEKALAVKEEMITKGMSPHVFGYNNLILACAKAGDLKKANNLFTEMRNKGIAPTAVTYNILMHEYADQGSLANALSLYKQMKSEGVKPNQVTLTTLVHACCRVGNVDKALALLKEMKEDGATVNPYTFNTLMDACARKGMMETAFSLFTEMKAEGFSPDLSVYNTLLSGCARKVWEERAFSLMEGMKEQGISPDKTSYTHLINACARNGSTERAFAVFKEMKEKNLSPGFSNYASLIDACAHMGMVDSAFSLYEEMKHEAQLAPDLSIYSSLVDVCVRGAELDRAFQVVEEMKKAGHKPDVILFNSLLGGCVRKGMEEKAFSVLEEMSKEGIEPDVVTFMTLIHRHAGEGLVEKAEAILTDMLGQGVQPDKAFYTALIKASRKVGKYTKQVKRWQGEIKKLEEGAKAVVGA